MAATGASVAASPAIASTFFSGGLLSLIGIGTAATPVGWVIAAAVVTGGAYYGVTRLVQRRAGAFVETIPRFINTPIDLLGMQLFDLIGALALRVADIDGTVAPAERDAIKRHFVEEWGYDPAYVTRALEVLEGAREQVRVQAIARTLCEFQTANPDCNAEAMQAELMSFLRDVMEADGVLDEREELAIAAITSVFRKEQTLSVRRVGQALSEAGGTTASAVGALKKGLARLRPRTPDS
jgi:uncharacterized tellurite resistance protein B-like protein